jgi:hypothetical protein
MQEPLTLGLYQHYNGNFYQVIGLCRHSETSEELVVYQALYGDYGLWVRPLNMFLEKVSKGGQTVPRFKFIRTIFDRPPNLREK